MVQERMEFIKRLALEAGRLTLEGYGKCEQMPKDVPEGYYDIATEYDLRTEELVRKRILDEFGEPILGEEDGLIGDRDAARRALWIVDPIDGTFNYQRGQPLYAVSIAYCKDGVPACGAIYLPALDELFTAARGGGAFLEEGRTASPVPVRVAQERKLDRLVISLAGNGTYELLAASARQAIPWRSLRLLLCAVASMAYVAAGRIDAFTDTSLNLWDCAAGYLLLQEAGGPASARQAIPWRSLRLLLCAVASMAYVAAGRIDCFTDTSLNLWDCAAGDLLLQEAGGPASIDYRGVPIFPEYVNRHLDLEHTGGFSIMGASSQELLQDPLQRLIAATGLQV